MPKGKEKPKKEKPVDRPDEDNTPEYEFEDRTKIELKILKNFIAQNKKSKEKDHES